MTVWFAPLTLIPSHLHSMRITKTPSNSFDVSQPLSDGGEWVDHYKFEMGGMENCFN